MKVVVITGGIGSGKSLACRFLEKEYGYPVYYADSRVKELYVKSPVLLDNIEKALHGSFRDENGCFSPGALAAVIFTDRKALDTVEGYVFPELTSDFNEWKEKHSDSEYVIIESATILEKPALRDIGDVYILIDAPVELRAKRASGRDRVDLDSVMQRMSSQKLMNAFSEKDEITGFDVVIRNDSSLDDFYVKLRNLAENLP